MAAATPRQMRCCALTMPEAHRRLHERQTVTVMTQRQEKRVPLTEQEKIAAGYFVPFFAPKREKSSEGRWFTPYFAAPEGIDTTKRRAEPAR
jgi:hypothetical protein